MDPLDFSDQRSVFVNCTLKRSPEVSNTAGLMAVSEAIMRKHGVVVDEIRAVDYDLAPGVYPDMTDHGWPKDDWHAVAEVILAADILVVGTPIWLGDKSSVCTRVIERLYSLSGQLNDARQYLYYGRAGGVVVTGNDDGVKHVAMNWNLMHLAAILKRGGGFPAHGNQRSAWDAGARFDHPNPEYR